MNPVIYTEAEGFPAPIVSYSSPGVVINKPKFQNGNKPFKFFNFWTKHPDFFSTVSEVWNKSTNSNPMYQLCSKNKSLEPQLKDCNQRGYGYISDTVIEAKVST